MGSLLEKVKPSCCYNFSPSYLFACCRSNGMYAI